MRDFLSLQDVLVQVLCKDPSTLAPVLDLECFSIFAPVTIKGEGLFLFCMTFYNSDFLKFYAINQKQAAHEIN